MFNQYIDNLAYNIDKPKTPVEMDIVLEGGAYNGAYELGVLLFVKHLEDNEYIRVNRISGASIGSLMGALYLTNSLLDMIEPFETLKTCFKDNLHLRCYEKEIGQIIQRVDEDIFEGIKKNKLFIAMINVQDKEQVVVNEFATKEVLVEAIVKSCYLPYILGESVYYKDEFVDGCFPYIFPSRGSNDVKMLYVTISRFKQTNMMFCARREKNIHGRVLQGILDAYMFFLYEKSTAMCSYVNNWSLIDYVLLRSRQGVIITFYVSLLACFQIYERLRPYIRRIPFSHLFIVLGRHMCRDIALNFCF